MLDFGVHIGIETVHVIIGPISYLLLSNTTKGVPKTFHLLSLLDAILPATSKFSCRSLLKSRIPALDIVSNGTILQKLFSLCHG